jgi:glycosyltransferase involved in cell wall biosynthesis
MNVFVIPSWYPSEPLPVDGVFFREQALALADLRPDWNVAVSVWAQSEGALWVTQPTSWPRALAATTVRRGPALARVRSNLVELRKPTLTWSHVALSGNRGAVLRANRANLRRALDELGSVDVIHAHVSYPAGWVAMRLSAETGIPYVLTEHMGPFPFPEFELNGDLSPLVRDPLEGATEIVAVSAALRHALGRYGFDDVTVIPNAVDETFFGPEPRGPNERTTFFTLANLLPIKGVDVLVRAIAELDGDGARFRIGGDGPQRARLRRLAAELGVDGKIEWLGRLNHGQAREEYRRADCFVLPSRLESFGVVCVEAMACGIPVVATRCGGPEDIVTAETGALVDPEDPSALAAAVGEMRDGGAERFDSEAIRGSFLERFSRPSVVSALEDVYRSAVVPS